MGGHGPSMDGTVCFAKFVHFQKIVKSGVFVGFGGGYLGSPENWGPRRYFLSKIFHFVAMGPL